MKNIFIGNSLFIPKTRVIKQEGREIKIRNKESELLFLLCKKYPNHISREEIEKQIWTQTYVTDNTLTQTISNLRNGLNDKKHEIIITIPKKGYCLNIEPKFIDAEKIKIENLNSDFKKNSTLKNIPFFKNQSSSTYILSGFVFFLFFSINFFIFFKLDRIKIIRIKAEKLPITVNLDEEKDKEFLKKYKNPPFIFLKKIDDGTYIACEPYKGGLTCLKK
ncbi:winged helix-turn-helix domain-containing protein [Candidatus Williamhamiltonella defendens]|uniref:Uncharacterized protein n=1 Tax=Candidatus Hamiltonella defensa (Bemisia tabaci) TaxID=672795 RepID=A0A249DY46_9ENTR|nr:winged helix-turn-helix domain-containing protein [Candidatus Hamiltonella defensa]ASX26195.1 hypothetical protein BA171_03610 [Candidatus Hamiltonella defensa (Bemisia tabaci)]CED78131.1 Putative regulatory membrane protein [Candidatus Hamiltonella defensa (Bemisia tabaci)]